MKRENLTVEQKELFDMGVDHAEYVVEEDGKLGYDNLYQRLSREAQDMTDDQGDNEIVFEGMIFVLERMK
jgi:hypothetical protein